MTASTIAKKKAQAENYMQRSKDADRKWRKAISESDRDRLAAAEDKWYSKYLGVAKELRAIGIEIEA